VGEKYDVVSVKGGKFHKPVNTEFNRAEPSWKPRLMQCGRTVQPLNFFETVDDADKYSGGRIERFGCKQCGVK
jgi:hypothetical protein